jgi:peptidoglycan/LPS O-acetylase OafA/YrhL
MLNESKIRGLIARREGASQWCVTLLDYFVKRILRVYPLFALVAIALTCMPEDARNHYYNLGHYNIKQWNLADILTFKKRYYLFWTLPIEMSYYFIIPLFLVGVCLLDKRKWFVLLPLYMWVYFEGGHSKRTIHEDFGPHLPVFLAGSLAAVVYLDVSRWMKRHYFEPRGWSLAVVRVLELLMVTSIMSDVSRGLLVRWFGGSLFPKQHPAVPSVSLPVSAIIVIEALVPSAIARALEWNVLCFTGKISFSMYLLHPFVNYQPWLPGLPRIDQFIVRLALTYALATVSYFVIEQNSQRLAVKISKRLTALR